MAHLIEFTTAKFDPAHEPANPINPIAGHGVLAWLREHVLPGATEPAPEDWGWYIEVECEGGRYLVGGTCLAPEGDPSSPGRHWMIQVHKHRSLVDKLLGRNRMQPDDVLVERIRAALRDEPAFRQLEETPGG